MRKLIDVDDAVNMINANLRDDILKREMIKLLNSFPTADERKTGKWIHEETEGETAFMLPFCHCSVCETHVQRESNFCPVCGAEMNLR